MSKRITWQQKIDRAMHGYVAWCQAREMLIEVLHASPPGPVSDALYRLASAMEQRAKECRDGGVGLPWEPE